MELELRPIWRYSRPARRRAAIGAGEGVIGLSWAMFVAGVLTWSASGKWDRLARAI